MEQEKLRLWSGDREGKCPVELDDVLGVEIEAVVSNEDGRALPAGEVMTRYRNNLRRKYGIGISIVRW